MVEVLDISKHQGSADFKAMKDRKIKGAMLRLAYGNSKDSKFEEFYQNAVKNSMPVGVYVFATWHYKSVSKDFNEAKKNALSQTKNALEFIKGKKISAFAIDMELEKGCETKLSKAELTEILNLCICEIFDAGLMPLVYSSVSWFYDKFNASSLKCDFWVAYYYNNAKKGEFPDTRYGRLMGNLRGKIALWQYTSTLDGRYYGVGSKCVDGNFLFINEIFESKTKQPQKSPAKTEKSLYTVKLNKGKWYVRKSGTMSSKALKIIDGGVTLQASQKKNGWYYLVAYKGWVGPKAVESAVFNK